MTRPARIALVNRILGLHLLLAGGVILSRPAHADPAPAPTTTPSPAPTPARKFKAPLGTLLRIYTVAQPMSYEVDSMSKRLRAEAERKQPRSKALQNAYFQGYVTGVAVQTEILCNNGLENEAFRINVGTLVSELNKLTPDSDPATLMLTAEFILAFNEGTLSTARKYRLCEGVPDA